MKIFQEVVEKENKAMILINAYILSVLILRNTLVRCKNHSWNA